MIVLEAMAPRRKFTRGTKRMHSSTSPQTERRRNEKFPTDDTTHWLEGELFSPVGLSLDTLRNTTTGRVPDKHTREQLLRDELIKVGNYVENYLSSPQYVNRSFMSKKSRQQCW